MILRCATCGVDLTRTVAPLVCPGALNITDGEPIIPVGCCQLSTGDYYPAGEWIVNLSDLVNTALHPELRRRNGCCGLDGCDGMNRVCVNGHEVGTERSDCWWAHGIHFNPDCVIVTDR
jgi:hypothetical protein